MRPAPSFTCPRRPTSSRSLCRSGAAVTSVSPVPDAIFSQCPSSVPTLRPGSHRGHRVPPQTSLDSVSQDVPVFVHLGHFEECWSSALQNVPRLGFAWGFCHLYFLCERYRASIFLQGDLFFLRDMSIVGTSEDVPGDVERLVLGELVGTHGNGFSRSLLLRPRSQVSTWSSGSRRVLFEQLG